MNDPALIQFTAHELTRDDLHALMARSDRPALLRALWHFGALAVTGTLLWRLAATVWAVPPRGLSIAPHRRAGSGGGPRRPGLGVGRHAR